MSSFISDNRCFSQLFADEQIAEYFSADRMIDQFMDFEMALTTALRDHGVVCSGEASAALDAMRAFSPNINDLAQGTFSDGLPVPQFIKSLKAHAGEDASKAIHIGATSQDLIDTGLVLSLRLISQLLSKRIAAVVEVLETLEARFGHRPMMGRTRMQAALPIKVSDRTQAWRAPLLAHLNALAQLQKDVEQLQFGGAVGTRHALGEKGDVVAEQLADHFGLGNPPKAWHSDRSAIAAYGDWLSRVTGSLGKVGMDIALMAQQGVDEITLSGGGGSSAMPHKQNPVLAELLVTMARFNAVQVSGLHQALIHEQERSGMAWALEWMILPIMAETTGKALLNAFELLKQVERIGSEP